MKYVVLTLFLAAVAAAEVLHELKRGDATGSALCMDTESKQDAASAMLMHHLHSHR